MAELINLTPHEITIYDPTGQRILRRIASTGVARVTVSQTETGDIDGIPAVRGVDGPVTGLSASRTGTWLIVSDRVKQAARFGGRTDLCAPDTAGAAVRDPSGQILGVWRLTI